MKKIQKMIFLQLNFKKLFMISQNIKPILLHTPKIQERDFFWILENYKTK